MRKRDLEQLFAGAAAGGVRDLEALEEELADQADALAAATSRHRDQLHALDMLARDIGGIRSVVSSVVELDAAPDAFASIRAGEVLKVVVAPA